VLMVFFRISRERSGSPDETKARSQDSRVAYPRLFTFGFPTAGIFPQVFKGFRYSAGILLLGVRN
jgi:hypothetical protein